MNKHKLQIEQLDRKMRLIEKAAEVTPPPTGWIKAIRLSLGMSLQQLANKLGITRQSALDIEVREQNGSISLKRLQEAAEAMDMRVVYALVPKDGSLENLIDRKARELATKIVSRTSQTMRLEDQEPSPERLQKAVETRVNLLREELPKSLWD